MRICPPGLSWTRQLGPQIPLPSPLRSTPHILLKEGDDKSATIIAKLEANNPLASVKVSRLLLVRQELLGRRCSQRAARSYN